MASYRRLVIGTYVLPDTASNPPVLTFSSGVVGTGTQGYLKARNGNAAALYLAQDNDASNEPRIKLAAGETLPILLDYAAVAALWVKGSAADVLEFSADASE